MGKTGIFFSPRDSALVANGLPWVKALVPRVQTDIHIQMLTMVGITLFQIESHSRKNVISVKELLLPTFLDVSHRSRQNFARLGPN